MRRAASKTNLSLKGGSPMQFYTNRHKYYCGIDMQRSQGEAACNPWGDGQSPHRAVHGWSGHGDNSGLSSEMFTPCTKRSRRSSRGRKPVVPIPVVARMFMKDPIPGVGILMYGPASSLEPLWIWFWGQTVGHCLPGLDVGRVVGTNRRNCGLWLILLPDIRQNTRERGAPCVSGR